MLKEIKESTPSEMGPYLCSKWIHHYFLIDFKELEDFLLLFNINYIFPIGKIMTNDKFNIVSDLVCTYKNVIEKLKESKINLTLLKKVLPVAIGKSPDDFYLFKPKDKVFAIKIAKPVLQLQLNLFRYSPVDQKISFNTLGSDSIFWGFKLSYPQIFQDPKSSQIFKIDSSFSIFSYFSLIRKWLRTNTTPVRLIINGKKISTALKIGKNCLPWINLHPQLKKIDCEIDNYAH